MKYCRINRNLEDRRNNGRNFGNRRNYKRNHEWNSWTSRDNEEQRNIVSELREELNKAFVKGTDISKENLDDDEIGRSKLVVEFDSIKLN